MSHNWVPNFTHTLHFIIFATYFHLFIRFSWFFFHQIHFNGTISRFVYNFESQNFKLIVHCSRPLKVRLVTSQSNLNRRQFNSCIIKLVSTKKSSNWIIVCVQSSCACSAKRSKKKNVKYTRCQLHFILITSKWYINWWWCWKERFTTLIWREMIAAATTSATIKINWVSSFMIEFRVFGYDERNKWHMVTVSVDRFLAKSEH